MAAQPQSTSAHQFTNRLAGESSPYLRQHMHNPVDWRPWGPEAFAEARRRNAPIFLSVGYSTCYWCHVMERECFENEQIAGIMNKHFVCVKVDREERPDVDDVYMAAVQLFSDGHGGWPMSVWLTPPGTHDADDRGLEPFFAGTYFPPTADPRFGRPSFPQLLQSIAEHWSSDREQIVKQARSAADALREQLAAESDPVALSTSHIGQAVSTLLRIYDQHDAGFGRAPKFPQPVFLEFLLDARAHLEDPAIASMATRAVRHTLDRMAIGGMYDQVGGGFHRYSVDAHWIVPHFEKMLYDNGQLASLYARSYLLSGDELDARIVRETLDYVLREMTDPASGACYSAQDAEVNHREGENYLWTSDEIRAVLSKEDADFAIKLYGLDHAPNFRDPHHPDDPAKHVLCMNDRDDAQAARFGFTVEQFIARRSAINAALYTARAKRQQPGTDDKVITAWNGLMIAGMADGAAALRDEKYLRAARRAVDAILNTMRTSDGGLLRTSRAGQAKIPAFLEDYAMLAHACVALHRASASLGKPDPASLRQAIELTQHALERFGERHTSITNAKPVPYVLLYDTLPDQSDLLVRHRGAYDGAVPSGVSVLAHVLIDLFHITNEPAFIDDVRRVLVGLSRAISESPAASINAVRALHRFAQIDASIFDAVPDSHASHDHAHETPSPVRVFASTDRVTVSRDTPATLHLKLELDDGYHINAANPVPSDATQTQRETLESLIPLAINVEGGVGVEIKPIYPRAELFRGGDTPVMVHAGDVEIELRLTRTSDAWTGRPMLTLTYQACTDAACLAPMTVELDVALDPG